MSWSPSLLAKCFFSFLFQLTEAPSVHLFKLDSSEWATKTCLAHGQNLSQIPLLPFFSDWCSKCTIMSKTQVHRNDFLQAHPCCFHPGLLHAVTELNLFLNIPLHTHSLCLECPSHWSQWSLQPKAQLSCLHVQMSTFLSPLHDWPPLYFREIWTCLCYCTHHRAGKSASSSRAPWGKGVCPICLYYCHA